jgi:hypothetical protein
MLTKRLNALGLLLLLLASCKTTKKATDEQPVYQELITDESFRKLIKNKELFNTTTETVLLDSANVVNDTIHVFTKKVQACDAENFKLVWNGSFAKSLPPQVSLKLLLINEPTCKELHRFHITYNISSVWSKKDSIGVDSLLLKLPGLNSGIIRR